MKLPRRSQQASKADSDLSAHLQRLRACRLCSGMKSEPVCGHPVVSQVLLVGQAPGDREPVLGRPFAWTAGRTLFRWFEEAAGLAEAELRHAIYWAAVCRCFPGKKSSGGDRVPSPVEIENCSAWLEAEMELIRPKLVIPVGKLAITLLYRTAPLEEVIGKTFQSTFRGHAFDLIPLPHPSGASPWPRMEPGKTLLRRALRLIAAHPAFQRAAARFR